MSGEEKGTDLTANLAKQIGAAADGVKSISISEYETPKGDRYVKITMEPSTLEEFEAFDGGHEI